MKFVMECGPCDGDKAYALDLVDLFAERFPGVAMKVQFYTAETITARQAPRYDRTDDRNVSQWDLFQDQLDYDDWAEVAIHARNKAVEFFPSVFSEEAVDKASEMGIRTLKIASGDITNLPLIRYASTHARQLVISTGASTEEEILRAMRGVGPTTFLACHLAYPTHTREAHLRRILNLRTLVASKANVSVGYSDHTPDIYTVAPLITLGAEMWEKHFSARTWVHDQGDHAFAIRPRELAKALSIAEATKALLGKPDLAPTPSEFAARQGARRSLASKADISRGEPITIHNTTALRPATGLSLDSVRHHHMVAAADIPAFTTITPDMVASP